MDYFDAKRRVIHEIKRSDKVEKAHEWQVKYYIYVFERNGIEGCTGLLELFLSAPSVTLHNLLSISVIDGAD